MPLEHLDRVSLVLEAVVERIGENCLSDHLLLEPKVFGHVVGQLQFHRRVNGIPHALVPGFRIAYREQHLRIRVMSGDFAPPSRPRPIDRRAEVAEYQVPVQRMPECQPMPQRGVIGSRKNFHHVIAGAEAEFFKRVL
jgi:hypothetical protein